MCIRDRPKGVCIHWDAICNHDRWFIDEYQLAVGDRCSQIASIGFDISIEEIFTTLRSGACLVSITKQALDSPLGFFRWVEDQQLTVINMPTALWHNVVPALEADSLPDSLRVVLIGGEQVNPDMVETWFKHVPPEQIRLVNAYGPTETTITATVSDLSPTNRTAIGRAVRNLACHVIGENGELIDSRGVAGELYISGVGVASGYWNRPEQTAKAFLHSDVLGGRWCYRTGDKVHWDENDQLQFLGRVDNQVKLRGFRIELHEIENSVCKHPQISNAIVRKTDSGREQLVCFATLSSTSLTNMDSASLQQDVVSFMKETLPHYMIPAKFLFLEEFPTTVGGKVDTKKMMSMVVSNDQQPVEDLEGFNQLQTQIAQIWQSVLGNAPATIETTFEQSGGDSLAAMALALGLERAFPHKTFGVVTLLSYPTVSQLADYVAQTDSDCDSVHDEDGGLMPIINSLGLPLDSETPCLICLHPGGGSCYLYNLLFDESLKQTHSILVLDSPWLTGELPGDDCTETVRSIAQRYVDVLVRRLAPGTRIITAGYSFGGMLAFEAARFFMEKGFEIDKVINIDQPIPHAIKRCGLFQRLINWCHRFKTPWLTFHELSYSKKKNALQAGDHSGFRNPIEMKRSFDLEDIHAEVEDAYEPQPCDVELHVIRGDVIEAKYLVDNDYGWKSLSTRLFVHRTTGSHFTIFNGRNLRKLSVRFQNLFRTTSN